MELVPTAISAGWASGVNAYATVALLGLLGRAGVGEVPDPLTGTPVIATALVLFAIEFVADKVPYVDNTWDLIQTPVRPAVGSAVGALFAGDADVASVEEALTAAGSGGTALASHGLKSGLRLGVNASPEPFSNIVLSLAEDGLVAGVVALALKEPLIALAIVVCLLTLATVLVVVIWTRIRRALRAWQERGWLRAPPRSPP